jgi:hypothetical protein
MKNKEEKIINNLKKANEVYEKAARAIEEYFFPLLDDILAEERFSDARKLIARVPDCVEKVFMMDKLRQAKLKHEGKLCKHNWDIDRCRECLVKIDIVK